MHNLRHTLPCGDGQREGGAGLGGVGQGEGMVATVIVSTLKIKLKTTQK